jgi:hypothetical protein
MMCRNGTSKPALMEDSKINKDGVHYGSRSSIESDALKVS